MRFLDTNILLYSISGASEEQRQRDVAIRLIDSRDNALSAQVLQEFYVQATRQTRPDRVLPEQASALVRSWRRFPIQALDYELVVHAMEISTRSRISYWDAAIVAAAVRLGCTELLSEDLGDGQVIEGVSIRNPFAPWADAPDSEASLRLPSESDQV